MSQNPGKHKKNVSTGKKIHRDANKLMISFHKQIYKPSAVATAMKDFSDAAHFSVTETTDYLRVTIGNVPPDKLRELAGEFCNYALVKSKG